MKALSKRYLTNIVQIRKDLRSLLRNKHDFSKPAVLSAVEMSHSKSKAIIPLSDEKYRLSHITAANDVRIGRLLEHLDTFAVHISYKHNNALKDEENNSHPLGIVTALADEVVIHNQHMTVEDDLLMEGHIAWTGKSSMEVAMKISQNDKPAMEALFLMVARCPNSGKAAQVCPVQPQNVQERCMFSFGEQRKIKRLNSIEKDLFTTCPDMEEAADIHRVFLSTLDTTQHSFNNRNIAKGAKWMSECKTKSILVAMPEHRNIHGKLFGGHIMRKAFELAYSNMRLAFGANCIAVAIDDIHFRAPVNIGCIYMMNSQVAYTFENFSVVRIYAQVVNPATSVYQTTNTFYFVYKTKDGTFFPEVKPKTYGEAILWTDAKRRFHYIQNKI